MNSHLLREQKTQAAEAAAAAAAALPLSAGPLQHTHAMGLPSTRAALWPLVGPHRPRPNCWSMRWRHRGGGGGGWGLGPTAEATPGPRQKTCGAILNVRAAPPTPGPVQNLTR